MSREALALWQQAALALDDVRTSFAAPIHVLLSEAVELVRFCRDYWQPVPKGELARPGLSERVGPPNGELPAEVADDLLSLVEALHTAQTEFLLTIPPLHAGFRARAERVLGELIAAIELLLDDGVHDERDQQLAVLRIKHAQYTSSAEALSIQLGDYAALASKMRSKLSALGGFDMSTIDSAHHLARELRLINDQATASEPAVRALNLRNRIGTLLVDRVNLVRIAAAAVFCDHPSIARLTMSSFSLRCGVPASRGPNSSPAHSDVPLSARGIGTPQPRMLTYDGR
jgi:hypothetical protein